MKSKSIVVFIILLMTSVGFAQERPCTPRKHAKIPAVLELTYAKARKRLLAAGWQPLQTKSFNEAENHSDISQGNGSLFWRRGYVELEVCSGTGVAACGFLFNDAYGNQLRVTTAGEELPASRARAHVTGFRFVCKSPESGTRIRLRTSRG